MQKSKEFVFRTKWGKIVERAKRKGAEFRFRFLDPGRLYFTRLKVAFPENQKASQSIRGYSSAVTSIYVENTKEGKKRGRNYIKEINKK